MNDCIFIPTVLLDPVGSGGTLEIGKEFNGKITGDQKKVFFSDANDRNWTFWPGSTCKIVSNKKTS